MNGDNPRYAAEVRAIAKLTGAIDQLLHDERADFSHGMSALLLAVIEVLGTIEAVATSAPQFAQQYNLTPFAALHQVSMQVIQTLDDHLRYNATEVKQ